MADALIAAAVLLVTTVAHPQTSPATSRQGAPDRQFHCPEMVAPGRPGGPSGQLQFAAVPRNSDPTRDRWRSVASEEAKQQAVKNGDSTASVSLRNGHVLLAQFTFQNEFGDWISYADYCFRPDGTLSHLHAQLDSFHGGVTVIRDLSFDPSGKQIARRQESYALGTRTPEKLDPDFWDQPPPVFRRVKDLPFAKDLPEASTSKASSRP